jgi:hypothetical protein
VALWLGDDRKATVSTRIVERLEAVLGPNDEVRDARKLLADVLGARFVGLELQRVRDEDPFLLKDGPALQLVELGRAEGFGRQRLGHLLRCGRLGIGDSWHHADIAYR